MHGFQHIMLIGDSGGNGRGMGAVAQKLNTEWNANPVVAHISQHYDYASVGRLLRELGVTKEGQPDDGLHDDPGITLNMFVTDPKSVRWEERVKAGKATINGVSIADKAKALEIGKKIVEMRATNTANAIKAAIANKGAIPAKP
jgi:creatinine amidohydrolase/Fe(II)-dependent formamide hydrolase-like protein